MNIEVAEVFDDAIQKLNAQTEKAYDTDHGGCRYRFNGASCLFGLMVNDENYDPKFDCGDGLYVGSDEIMNAISESTGVYLPSVLNEYEIVELQAIHDESWSPGVDMRELIPDCIKNKIWGASNV